MVFVAREAWSLSSLSIAWLLSDLIRLGAGVGVKLFLHFHILDVQLQRIISREYCHFNGLNLNICLFICLIIATSCSPSISTPKRIFQVVSCRNLSMVITSEPLSEGETSARTDRVKLNDFPPSFYIPAPAWIKIGKIKKKL